MRGDRRGRPGKSYLRPLGSIALPSSELPVAGAGGAGEVRVPAALAADTRLSPLAAGGRFSSQAQARATNPATDGSSRNPAARDGGGAARSRAAVRPSAARKRRVY